MYPFYVLYKICLAWWWWWPINKAETCSSIKHICTQSCK